MALIGLLLILATGAFAAGVLYSGDNTGVNVVVFGTNGRTVSLAMFFQLGALTGLAFAIACGLLFSGLGRRRVRRNERRIVEARELDEQEALRTRNAELERKLDLTRNAERRRAELNGTDATTAANYEAYPDEPVAAEDTTTLSGRHRRR
jgi:hypothetical protein